MSGFCFNEENSKKFEKLKKRYPEGFIIKNAERSGTMVDWGKKEF